MQSLAASTGSKWISTTPNYPGDLFNNTGCYWPVVPDYTQPYWRKAHTTAEKFAYGSANAKYPYHNKAMFFSAASSGRVLLPQLMLDPQRVIDHARRFSPAIDGDYITMRRAIDVLDPQMMNNTFSINYRNNIIAASLANHYIPETYTVGPPHREQMLRSLFLKHSIAGGISFEDPIFEQHLWQIFVLLDSNKGIYGGDHAWSYNAPLEKACVLAIQYGSVVPLLARQGVSYDITDVYNRPVSLVDQAWEDARALVDLVGTRVKMRDGSEIPFRFETGAALLISRFMHDHMYRMGDRNLDINRAHPTVKAHYQNAEDQERFALLKEIMLPYLAEHCNWRTLHFILDEDPALKAYWVNHIEPTRILCKSEAEIENIIFSYLPRGGYEGDDLRRKIEQRRDKQIRPAFAMQGIPQLSHGQHMDPFDVRYDPKIYNDRNFARLGGTSSSQEEPDSDHYVREQAAAHMTLAEFLPDGLPPKDTPRIGIYVDDATGGIRAADFAQKHKIDHLGEQAAIIDPLANGGHSFAEEVAAENGADFEDRARELALGGGVNAAWRKEFGIGNIIPTSAVRQSLDMYKGYREGTKTWMYEALSADGPLDLKGAEETITRRLIDLAGNFLILTPGGLPDRACRYIVEGVAVATGLTSRNYEGGKFQFEFFMDHDATAPPPRDVPQKLDLADLIIHVGLKTKEDLDKRRPPKNRDRFVTMARLLQTYEMLIDPVNCNTRTTRDKHSGGDKKENIIDWNQVDPTFKAFVLNQPLSQISALTDIAKRGDHSDYEAFVADKDYQDFLNNRLDIAAWVEDPTQKAKLAHMIWFYMRVDRVVENKKIPVIGHLLIKGAHAFDHDDTIDLPKDYQAARNWRHNLSAKEEQNIFGQKTLHVRGPATLRP